MQGFEKNLDIRRQPANVRKTLLC